MARHVLHAVGRMSVEEILASMMFAVAVVESLTYLLGRLQLEMWS